MLCTRFEGRAACQQRGRRWGPASTSMRCSSNLSETERLTQAKLTKITRSCSCQLSKAFRSTHVIIVIIASTASKLFQHAWTSSTNGQEPMDSSCRGSEGQRTWKMESIRNAARILCLNYKATAEEHGQSATRIAFKICPSCGTKGLAFGYNHCSFPPSKVSKQARPTRTFND